jgi:hypothetical protein
LSACWLDDPDKRPTIHQVVKFLKRIIFGEINDDEINSFENNKIESLQESHSQSIMPDLSCMLSNDSIVYMLSKNSELYLSKLIQDHLNNDVDPDILNQAERLFLEIFDITDNINILIDKLIALLIKTQDD